MSVSRIRKSQMLNCLLSGDLEFSPADTVFYIAGAAIFLPLFSLLRYRELFDALTQEKFPIKVSAIADRRHG